MLTLSHKLYLGNNYLKCFVLDMKQIHSDFGETFLDYNSGLPYTYTVFPATTILEFEIELIIDKDDYEQYWKELMQNSLWSFDFGLNFYKTDISQIEEGYYPSNVGKVYYIRARGYVEDVWM